MNTVDDSILAEICSLLRENDINYWVCHGTLLGIIRENRLLPWDHDIDIAVWKDEVSKKEIIEILNKVGYINEPVFGDMDCLHFVGFRKKVDVSFYSREKKTASIKWLSPEMNIPVKLLLRFTEILCSEHKIEHPISRGFLYSSAFYLLYLSGKVSKIIMPEIFKNYIKNNLVNKLTYIGYSYNLELMKFKDMDYKNFQIRVPIDSKECLRNTYGNDWNVAKKDYVWHTEANNLVETKGNK